MGKTLSPVKRSGHGHGSSSSSSGAATSQASGAGGGREGSGSLSGGNSSDDALQQLTVRTERVESTIVSRENATHAAFAASRTSDFVYAASSHYLHLLNDYCNNSNSNTNNTTTSGSSSSESSNAKSLMVVVGQPGMGKSALLAHWAAQRRASEDGANEFIYEHYCGCSYDSVKLSLFLFRLMNQLKLTYALRDFELPREHDEEKLKFSFARCLEAAVGRTNQRAGSNASTATATAPGATGATKGGGRGASSSRRIVLVLDGIDCLRTEDGGDSLSWLPNNFPDGVRIIVSATHGVKSSTTATSSSTGLQSARMVVRKPVAYDGDGDLIYDTTLPAASGDVQDSHTIRELRRRRTSFVVVEPLDETACRGVLQLYNHSSKRSSSSPQESTSQLSESEQNAVVSAPGSSSPLYLRLVLQGQELFGSSSGSGAGTQEAARHAWLDSVMRTGELHVVYELLMRRWTDLLLEDLEEQQHKLLHPATTTDGSPTGPGKLTRRATKRDVVADAHHNQSHGEAATNQSQSQSQSQSQRPSLHRTPSMRSTNANAHATTTAATAAAAVDPVEWEALQTAMEQRVLLVRHTLSLLAVSRYGLSETDLQRLLGDAVPKPITHKLLLLLQPHVMRIRRRDCGDDGGGVVVLLDLSHNQLRLLVRYSFLRDDHLRGCYYKELATYFSGLEASQRRLDELPVQLERCAMWSTLQAALVDIKMFQLWWSERNRQELFSYWMVLRTNCSIHDPVDDFVRSLDEYIIHESPSAEQLLALCLTITDFLRTWQRIDDSRSSSLALARPAPPQLNEFVTSLGGVSQAATAQQSAHDARRVASEIDALCLHKSDAYFVRRWLWTQFPLLGVAFESRFLRTLRTFSSSAAATSTVPQAQVHAVGAHDGDHGSKGKKKKPMQTTVLPKSLQGNTTTKSSSGALVVPVKRAKPSLLMQSTTAKDKELHSSDATPASAATPPTTTTTDDGAFEFLSTENTELTVGSVSKFESQVVELRSKYDKLKFLAKERQAALKTLDSRLLDARAQARQADQSASQVDDLLDQIRQIQDETVLGRQRSDYYKAILRHCEIHPARDPNAIEVTETAVNKMKHEIVELQQKTQVASYEARLAAVESKKFQQVIDEKTAIHNTALERLRWRWELLQRMLQQQSPHTDDSDANSAELLARSDDDDDDDNDDGGGEEENNLVDNNNGGDQDGGGGGGGGAHGRRRSRMARKPSATEIEFNRAKDKLLHKKETSLERLRKVDQLKVYVGSPYKDDGVLGALRQVGINKPEEAHLYWQDQQQHAVQLEAEERNLELRVVEYRERLASLQSQLVNLKLGGSAGFSHSNNSAEAFAGTSASTCTPTTVSTTTAAPTAMCANVAAPTEPPLNPAATTTTTTTTTASQHNLKQLEQHVGDAQTIAQQKRERAARLKALSERLHLGLQHVAHIVGVCVTPQMESMELADAVEQVVRLYLGDEGHSQSTASTNLRRKNSVRAAMGLASQSGLHTAVVAPDTRTSEEKRRYNIRVSKSPQRQMNPYVDGDRVKMRGGQAVDGGEKEEEEEEEEEEVEEEEEDGDQNEEEEDGDGEHGGENNERNKDSVTRRADIKNRSRREVDRKLKALASKQEKADKTSTGNKTGKAGSTKRQSVVQ